MEDTKSAVKSLFAPRQLATPTDLKPEEVRAVTETVNRLIADAFALYVKTKNFHWHVASSHFRDYHLLLDEQADAIFGSIDILADNRYLAESQRTAIAVCDQNRDTPTGNLLQEMLDQTEKRIWFLHAVSQGGQHIDRKSTRLNSSHLVISYAVFCLKKKKKKENKKS